MRGANDWQKGSLATSLYMILALVSLAGVGHLVDFAVPLDGHMDRYEEALVRSNACLERSIAEEVQGREGSSCGEELADADEAKSNLRAAADRWEAGYNRVMWAWRVLAGLGAGVLALVSFRYSPDRLEGGEQVAEE